MYGRGQSATLEDERIRKIMSTKSRICPHEDRIEFVMETSYSNLQENGSVMASTGCVHYRPFIPEVRSCIWHAWSPDAARFVMRIPILWANARFTFILWLLLITGYLHEGSFGVDRI